MRRTPWVPLLIAGIASLAGCGARTIGGSGVDASRPDAAYADAWVQRDANLPTDAGTTPACGCPPGEVWRWHECFAPLEVGCGPGCEADDECVEGGSCLSCAASSRCDTRDCLSACVFTQLAMGPLPELLRIEPVSGPTDQTTEVRIMGWPFYIGALFFITRIGEDTSYYSGPAYGPCSFTVQVPPMAPGMRPVWVSQYGGEEPWVLAGFYTHSADEPPDCIQPGLHCGPGPACCSTPDLPVTCQQGRCRPTL